MPQLSPAHLAHLEASGLNRETIEARQYRSVSRNAELDRLGFNRAQQGPGLLIPIHGVQGEIVLYQLRRDSPRINAGGPIKYETPGGSSLRLDTPPGARDSLSDARADLWITEGVKKSDALAQHGAPAVIGLLGVWAWKRHNRPLDDWQRVALQDRNAYVVFDSDVIRKQQVQLACRQLAQFLTGRGARVHFVLLPEGGHQDKTGVDDYLAAGRGLEDLKRLVSNLPARDGQVPGELDVTDLNRAASHEAWELLRERGVEVYRFGRHLVRILEDSGGQVTTDTLTPSTMRGVIDKAGQCFKITSRGRLDVYPPPDLAEMLLADPEPPIPVLRGIVRVPVFARDGSLRTTPGYDPHDQLLFRPAFPPLPASDCPTLSEVKRAREIWDVGLLGDFPFCDVASRTNAMALALTPMVRDLIGGPTPMFGIEASTRGSGKGLLLRSILTPSLGSNGWANASLPNNEDELRKAITAYLRESRNGIVFDNITHPIRSGILAKALTDFPFWDDRQLGHSTALQLSVRCVWAFTANNPTLSDEIARRVVPIRLTPDDSHPEQRVGFRHPNLMSWVEATRAELIWGLHILAKHWTGMGRPKPTHAPELGSYECWREVVGGILEAAGYEDFLANQIETTAVADVDTERWNDFVSSWYDQHGSSFVSTRELALLAEDNDILLFGESEKTRTQSLGGQLHRRRDRYFGDLQLEKGEGAWRRSWRMVSRSGERNRAPSGSAAPASSPRMATPVNRDNLLRPGSGNGHTHNPPESACEQPLSGGLEAPKSSSGLTQPIILHGAVSNLQVRSTGLVLLSQRGTEIAAAAGDPQHPATLEALIQIVPITSGAVREDARRLHGKQFGRPPD